MEFILVGDGCRIATELIPAGARAGIYNFKRHRGLAPARNKGIELSAGRFIVFIDADCVAEKEWLENLLRPLTSGEAGGCGGRIVTADRECTNRDQVYGSSYFLPFAGLGNAAFRKDVLEGVGLFDERFSMHEESVDISWRVCLRGHVLEYAPEAVVFHRGRKGLRDFFSSGRGIMLLGRKYKKMLGAGILAELMKRAKGAQGATPGTAGALPFVFLMAGYIYQCLMEGPFSAGAAGEARFDETFLQPRPSMKPLALRRGTETLMKPNHILWWRAADSCRLADIAEGQRYELEGVSGEMWRYIMQRRTEEEILGRITAEREADKADVAKDLRDFIEMLYDKKMLVPDHAA